MMYIWYLLFLIVFPSALYLFVFGFISWFGKRKKIIKNSDSNSLSVAFCVPSFGNDAVILSSVRKNLSLLNRSKLKFSFYVLSDHQKDETREALKSLGVNVFEVDLEKSTKAKGISQFFQNTVIFEEYFYLLDIDNLLTESAIKSIEDICNQGFVDKKWYQFERISANEDSHVAVLDTWSEKVNNNVFRKGCQVLGVPPALIGSAIMAPTKSYIDHNLNIPEFITGGFDKWLDHMLIESKTKVVYLEKAQVLDEKISDLEQLQRQRTRWISAQIFIAKKLFLPMLKSLFSLRLLGFLKYAQLYIIPRVWHMALSVLFLILSLLFAPQNGQYLLLLNFVVLSLGLLFASKGANLYTLSIAIFKMAFRVLWRYLKVILGLKNAKENFVITEHKDKYNR